jgi:hypothetical protein
MQISEFRQCKYKNNKIYYKSFCKKCESKIQVERIRKNGLSDQQKIKFRIYKKKYIEQNKEKINEKYRLRHKNDIFFKIRKNISGRINKVLKSNNSQKFGQSILKFLGYSISDLKNHLEIQFDSKMTWENYGIYWHIDHIVPQSCLPYTSMDDDNFKKCWSLTNLRPLDARTNILDGATRVRHKINK